MKPTERKDAATVLLKHQHHGFINTGKQHGYAANISKPWLEPQIPAYTKLRQPKDH